jgi:uncharacterized RDD family membrane protein YckC
MGFEVLRTKQPAGSAAAMVLIIVLALLLLALAAVFAWLLLTGRGNDYLLGTMLAGEFMLAGLLLVLYARNYVIFRQVAEEREERLLW